MSFRSAAASALKDPILRNAMRNATDTTNAKRTEAFASIPNVSELRDEASQIRAAVIGDLARYVEEFSVHAREAGAEVHFASDAEAARRIVYGILQAHRVGRVAKAKSMITEEIGLNEYLAANGLDVVETDLGEYIVQLAGERPSHLTAPAIHKSRQQVGMLFSEKLGVDYSDDIEVLTAVARDVLREVFLNAEAGITGANFALADTGSIVLFTNEGNGRMCATLPPLNIVVMTLEKIIPRVDQLPLFMQLLPRSATGQDITAYLSILTGTRSPDEIAGAKELHIVIMDNGRSKIAQGDYHEILKCIRCGACMNVCPVYRAIGGHAYGSTYVGPMGIVLTSVLGSPLGKSDLADASTLCGACDDVCPVRVPLTTLIRRLRESKALHGFTSVSERVGMRAWRTATASPTLYRLFQKSLRSVLPFLRRTSLNATLNRMPETSGRSFRGRMR